MNSKILLLAAIFALTLARGYGIDVPEEIKDAFENDALPQMIESIEAHRDKAEVEIDDDLEDLEDPKSNGKADARPGWPCSRRRWLGGCVTRRRIDFKKDASCKEIRFRFIRRRSYRRRRGYKDVRQ